MTNEKSAPGAPEAAETDLRRVVNPSEMVRRPGFLMRLMARKFERVGFDLRFVGAVNEAARKGPVVYVCDRQSSLDYLYYNYAFLKFSLPLAYFANGIRTFWFGTLFRAVSYLFRRLFRRINVRLDERERLAAGVRAGRANLVFLRRRRSLVQWGGEPVSDLLRRLIELQREMDAPIMLVPQLVFWEKDPERYRRSLLDLVLGQPNAPGRLRKLIGFWRNYRKAFVQMGEPLDLREFLARHGETEAVEDLAERLRWALHHGLSQEQRPIRGPILKGARRLCDEIVRNEAFQTSLERHAHDEGKPVDGVRREARSMLREMAADFRIRYIEGFCLSLTLLWNRLFSGVEVDTEGLAKIREAAKGAPIVVLPAHRSHIDYLAISWAFYNYGLIPPHIAAGINLSFWPMGHIFRHSGAFFIRRSFRGNRLYALTLGAYLRKLVKEGYWIEFFIEGGRSRTGKCLPPKLGLLSNIVEAVVDGAARDIYFVPVSIGYERIVEEGAYARELSGAEKQSENLAGLLASTRVLGTKYGRLHLRFDDPVSLRGYLAERGQESLESTSGSLRQAVEALGYRLVEGINRATVVTTSSLVVAALLCHPKRGISKENLRMRVGLLIDIAARQGAPLAAPVRLGLQARRLELARAEEESQSPENAALPAYQRQRGIDRARGNAVREAVDEALRVLRKNKQARVESFGGEEVYAPVEDRRIALEIYKNSLVHLLVPYALLATVALAEEQDALLREDTLRRKVEFLRRLFRYEFIYAGPESFAEALANARAHMEEMGLLVREDGEQVRLHDKARHLLRFFRNTVMSFVESYWFVAHTLPEALESPLTERDLLKRLQQLGGKAFREGELRLPESVSSANFKHALRVLRDRGFVVTVPVESGRPTLRLDRPAAVFARQAEHLKSFLPR